MNVYHNLKPANSAAPCQESTLPLTSETEQHLISKQMIMVKMVMITLILNLKILIQIHQDQDKKYYRMFYFPPNLSSSLIQFV